jgi:ArsR family transcriptional regulator
MQHTDRSLYTAKAGILKALAHPTRLWMVEELGAGERCVCWFVEACGADFSTVSKHLSVLKQAGLVTDHRRGKQVFYRLTMPCACQFMNCVERTLQKRHTALEEAS